MNLFTRLIIVLVVMAAGARAQGTMTLTSRHGAAVTFNEAENGGWRAQTLSTPGGPDAGWAVTDRVVEVSSALGTQTLAEDWKLVESGEERAVFEQTAREAGLEVRRVYSFGPATNVLRVETWARALEGEVFLGHVELLNWKIPGQAFRETGAAPASFPLMGDGLFAGIEHITGEAWTGGESVRLLQRPRATWDGEWRFVSAAVVGWPLAGHGAGLPEEARMREAFIHYLDTVRVKPERIVLHSETWWTMMPPLSEKGVLEDIEALRRDFLGRTGMFFDTYCLDLGWSNPQTLWGVAEARFPNGFRTINERLNGLGAKLGMWFSPGSGYPDGLSNGWLQGQGYAMTPFAGFDAGVPCFALGTRYQREFKERVVAYAREYGLGHVILDFMAQRCDEPSHGHPVGADSHYAIAAGVADVLDGLRAVNPNIALEPMVCGYPPSPWWLMKTPFILGPAGDDVPYGRVPAPEWMEALVSARDVAYRAGQDAWLMPTNALETWDIIVQTPGEFENTAVMAIGRGRWFLSSYLKPSLMKPEDWDFFAALVRWARANKEHLGNAWQVGGKPEDRQAYGYMFRSGAKDLFCVRNPWIEERAIELPASAAATEARELRMIYPRRLTLARIEPGEKPPVLRVPAYETWFLETVPAAGDTVFSAQRENPLAIVSAGEPEVSAAAPVREGGDAFGMRYSWVASLNALEVEGAELCVLVEGAPAVEHAQCEVTVNGQPVKVQVSKSAGQFGAAITASPENWAWFLVPLPKGAVTVSIEARVPMTEASVGVFLRGSVNVASEPAPEAGEVFPVFKPEKKAWSQTLAPMRAFELLAP